MPPAKDKAEHQPQREETTLAQARRGLRSGESAEGKLDQPEGLGTLTRNYGKTVVREGGTTGEYRNRH